MIHRMFVNGHSITSHQSVFTDYQKNTFFITNPGITKKFYLKDKVKKN